jgi:hypothetical protein
VLGWYQPHFGDYAEFYRRAASCLVDDALAGRWFQDQLAYPIVYLYRHDSELALKDANMWAEASISGRVDLGLLGEDERRTFAAAAKEMRVHQLAPLLDRLATRLARIDGVESPSDQLRRVVAGVDAFDVDGQKFRYPFLTKGRGSAWNPDQHGQILVDLQALKDDIDPVLGELLDGYGNWLMADATNAMQALGEGQSWENAERDWQEAAQFEVEAARAAWDASVAAGEPEWDLERTWRDRGAELNDDGDDR